MSLGLGLGPGDVARLACPDCRGALSFSAASSGPGRGEAVAGALGAGALECGGCGARWPVEDGVPRLYREAEVRGTDRLMRVIYDGLPWLHDPLTTALFPLLQRSREAEVRERIITRLELGALVAPADRPLRILEVGVGAGANLPLVYRGLAQGRAVGGVGAGEAMGAVEIWGLDLSRGMLAECRALVSRHGYGEVRLLLGDAHSLPFGDGAFDRVFHVGGIGGYRDPGKALAEMARVAVPGTPIVVVDEQLDPGRRHGLVHRALFRALTFYDRDPHCPRELLPPGSYDVLEEQVSRYYYCLRFRHGRSGAPRAREDR
jgi:ubiquinone/menaquinone biosynthesis C-methylase UbiE/uncharacterized protein YbaR (Trm112 family)